MKVMKKYYIFFTAILCIMCAITLISYNKKNVFRNLTCTYVELSIYSEEPIQRTLSNPSSIKKCLAIIDSSLKRKNILKKQTNHSPDISIKLFYNNGKPLQILVYGNTILVQKRQQYLINYDRLYEGLLQLK